MSDNNSGHLFEREIDILQREIEALKIDYSTKRTIDNITFMIMHVIAYVGLIYIVLS